MTDQVRIDKWLWAMRIFKTRSQAAAECLKGRILAGGTEAKPSRMVHVNDLIVVKKLPVVYTYRVKQITDRRLPAKDVPLYLENLTSEEELAKLDMVKLTGFAFREKGTGRPTKKERRELDRLRGR
jgi:ribosome-associated heat shock protein Hsp15